MTEWNTWLLFIHVASAMVWLGGGIAMCLLGYRARGSADAAELGDFGRTLSYVGLRAFTPSVVLVLVTGIWMVLAGTGDFGDLWVIIALVAFVTAFLIGAVYLSRQALLLERLSRDGDAPRARLALQRWLTGYSTVLLVLLVALWDMIFKPGI